MDNLPHYFQSAESASLHSDFPKRFKMGAVIVKNKSIIAFGFNQLKSHPRFSDGKKTYSIHAEMSAIIKSKIDLDGCDIYIYRMADNSPAIARPCKNCLPVLIESGISRIYYTIQNYPYWQMEKL